MRITGRTVPPRCRRARVGGGRRDHLDYRALLEWILVAVVVVAIVVVYLSAVRVADLPAVDTHHIRVAPGDTLWSLARTFPVPGLTTSETVALIASLNDIDAASLYAGQGIAVPASTSTTDIKVALRE